MMSSQKEWHEQQNGRLLAEATSFFQCGARHAKQEQPPHDGFRTPGVVEPRRRGTTSRNFSCSGQPFGREALLEAA
jgi:hypothetical protein